MKAFFNVLKANVENTDEIKNCCLLLINKTRESKLTSDIIESLKNTIKQSAKHKNKALNEKNLNELMIKLLFDCPNFLRHFYQPYDPQVYSRIFDCINELNGKVSITLISLAKGNLYYRIGEYLTDNHKSGEVEFNMAVDLLSQVKDEPHYESLAKFIIGECNRIRSNIDDSYYIKAVDSFLEVLDKSKMPVKYAFEYPKELKREYYLYFSAQNKLGACYLAEKEFTLAVKCFTAVLVRSKGLVHIKENGLTHILNDIIKMDFKSLNERVNTTPAVQSSIDKGSEWVLGALVNMGLTVRKRGEVENAFMIFNIITKYFDSNNIDAKINISECLRKNGQFYEALSTLEGLKDVYYKAKQNIIRCYIKLNQTEKAEMELNEILLKNKNDLWANLQLGILYRNKFMNQEAIEIFEKLLDTGKFNNKAYRIKALQSIGNCKLVMCQYTEAKQYFQKILEENKKSNEANSDDILALMGIGWCLLRQRYYNDAIEKYKRVLALEENVKNLIKLRDFTKISALNNIGTCLCFLANGNYNSYEEAIKWFEKTLEIQKYNEFAKFYIAYCKFRQGKYKEAHVEFLAVRDKSTANFKHVPKGESYHLLFLLSYLNQVTEGYLPDDETAFEVKNLIMDYLKNNPRKKYSLRAAAELFGFIEKEEDPNLQKSMNEDFSSIFLYDSEEGCDVFKELFKILNGKPFKNKNDIKGKIKGYLFSICLNISEIKYLYRVSEPNLNRECDYAHYTRIESLKKIIANPKTSRLRLWNSAYMNDNSEGKILFKVLEEIGKARNPDSENIGEIIENYNPNKQDRVYSTASSVYMTSLSKKLNALRMWVHYADMGTGCNLIFERDFFDIKGPICDKIIIDYEPNEYPLYMVQYINDVNGLKKNSKGKESLKYLHSLYSQLERLEETLKEINDTQIQTKIRNFVTNSLNEICFLFKHTCFEDESEVRVIRCSNEPKIDDSEYFTIPRLYIDLDKKVAIKKVMLGAKNGKANEIIPWLYATKTVKDVILNDMPFC